jgi:hypothetical protein
MNTKIRISIWIVALFLVFSGIGLSSQKALAASGSSIQRTALISVYHGYALATVYDGLPYSVAILRQASRLASLTTLNINDIDESRLIEAYNLQALARSSALTSLSVNDIDESRLIEAYSSRVRYYFELHPRPWR